MNSSVINDGKKAASSSSISVDNEENKTASNSKMSSFRPGGLNMGNIRRERSCNNILGGTRKSAFSSGLKIGGK
jgi:hypothetical protein